MCVTFVKLKFIAISQCVQNSLKNSTFKTSATRRRTLETLNQVFSTFAKMRLPVGYSTKLLNILSCCEHCHIRQQCNLMQSFCRICLLANFCSKIVV